MIEEPEVETPAETEVDDKGTEAIWAELTKSKADMGDIPPAKVLEPEQKAEEAPKVEAPASADSPAKVDPWQNAPPELREAHERDLEAIRTRAEQAETTARRHSGRLSKQEQELADLRARLSPQRDEAGAAKAGEEAKSREERLKQLQEEYPDVAGPILTELADKEARLDRIEGVLSRQDQAQTSDLLDEQVSILTKAQPGWETDIKDNPEFVKWAVGAPEYVKAVIRENAKQIVSGDDVADVIERYRRDTADPEKERADARRKEQLDAGRVVDVRNPGLAAPKGEGTVEQTWDELNEERRRKEAGNRR